MIIIRYFLPLLFPLIVLSAPIDFTGCKIKYQVSSIKLKNTQAFAVSGDYALFFSKEKPKVDIVKRDPFLGLNLIGSSKKFKHVFKFYNTMPSKLAAISPVKITKGKILSNQNGLNRLATFSRPIKQNSIISGSCCGIIGIATSEGIIQKEYIRHFLKSKEPFYSDIGIRLDDLNGVRVAEVNPFFKNSPFLLGDIILYINGEKIKNSSQVARKILFSKVGKVLSFRIKRAEKTLSFTVETEERLAGGCKPDTFFEKVGLEFNDSLTVVKGSLKFGIKAGDKLLSVSGKSVKNPKEVRRVLSMQKNNKSKTIETIFQRNGFDFFIHFLKPFSKK